MLLHLILMLGIKICYPLEKKTSMSSPIMSGVHSEVVFRVVFQLVYISYCPAIVTGVWGGSFGYPGGHCVMSTKTLGNGL